MPAEGCQRLMASIRDGVSTRSPSSTVTAGGGEPGASAGRPAVHPAGEESEGAPEASGGSGVLVASEEPTADVSEEEAAVGGHFRPDRAAGGRLGPYVVAERREVVAYQSHVPAHRLGVSSLRYIGVLP